MLQEAIQEKELMLYVEKNAVMTFRVHEMPPERRPNTKPTQTPKPRWQLVVRANWRDEECVLETSRGQIRQWVTLDAVIGYIKNHLRAVKYPVEVVLRQPESED